MKKIAALLIALPLVAAAQESQPPPPPPQYAPPPQYTPPPPPQYPPVQQPYVRPPQTRDSWYIGFGFGASAGGVSLNGDPARIYGVDSVDFKGDTFSGNIRIGATITPKLLIGFDGGFAASDGDQAFAGFSDKLSLQLNYYDVGIMFFPAERGFFLRAAAGLSALSWKDSVNDQTGRGVNFLGGIGYAWWIGKSFNLTFNVDAIHHEFNDNGFVSGNAYSAWVGFDWY